MTVLEVYKKVADAFRKEELDFTSALATDLYNRAWPIDDDLETKYNAIYDLSSLGGYIFMQVFAEWARKILSDLAQKVPEDDDFDEEYAVPIWERISDMNADEINMLISYIYPDLWVNAAELACQWIEEDAAEEEKRD